MLCVISQALLPKPYELPFALFWNITEHLLLGLAIFLYWKIPYTISKTTTVRPLFLAFIIIIAWINLSTALRVFTQSYGGFMHIAYYDVKFGLLMGLGLGLGIEAGNLIVKIKEEPEMQAE